MQDLAVILSGMGASRAVLVAFIFMILGMWIKMALFPLHGWLPNAYTYAPNSVSCLIAPLATKVSVYVMMRIIFTIFGAEYVLHELGWNSPVVLLASTGIIAGSLFALAQTDLKRAFTYIIVAEVGYMVGGVWLANKSGISGAGFHIVGDAMMTICLFMFIAILGAKTNGSALTNMRGLFARMPFTMAAFVLTALSLIGIPPTCGFFSKWYLVLGGIEAGEWFYVFALLFSSIINVVIFFRVFEIAHYPDFQEGSGHGHAHAEQVIDEAPWEMLVPLYCGVAALIGLGLYSRTIIEQIILPGLNL